MAKNSKSVTWERGGKKFVITLPFPPTPASRPRVTKWGAYYSKTYKAYRALAEKAIPESRQPVLTGCLKATIEFVCKRPKKITRITPVGDIDNYTKAILDAITGKKPNFKMYWVDDDQIVELYALKRYAREDEEPYTRIAVEEV